MEESKKSKDPKKGHLSEENEEKPEHSAHIKKLHHGYHVTKKHRDGSESEHASDDLDGAMDHVMDHMQSEQPMPNEQPMAEQAAGAGIQGPPMQQMEGQGA